MTEEQQNKKTIWVALYRRRVIGVAAAYAILAWGLIEFASVTLPAFGAPTWILQALIIIALVGCPIAIALSWVFDITPSGLQRTDVRDAGTVTVTGANDAATKTDTDDTGQSLGRERRQVCVLCCDFSVSLAGWVYFYS